MTREKLKLKHERKTYAKRNTKKMKKGIRERKDYIMRGLLLASERREYRFPVRNTNLRIQISERVGGFEGRSVIMDA